MKKLIISILFLSLCACASHQDYIDVAQEWQNHVTTEEVAAIGLESRAEAFKFETSNPDFIWTDKFVDEVMDYCYDLTTYALFVNPCCNVYNCCGPIGLQKFDYVGHCYSLATYFWCMFKYLDYPYNARIQWVRAIPGFNHVVFIIQMPDKKNWKMYNTAKLFGIEKIDEVVDHVIMEYDTQGIWFPPNLERQHSWVDHWTNIVN